MQERVFLRAQDGMPLSIIERSRKRRRKRQFRTLAMRLGVVLATVWTIVFGVGILIR